VLACAAGDRDHTSQVVVQSTTLIGRIIGTMLVLSIVMGMMMMHVFDAAAFIAVSSDILLVLEGMLDMGADQRHDARSLGEHKKPQEQRTDAPYMSQREHLQLNHPLLSSRWPARVNAPM
jgi:hypothetical protein